MLKVLPPETGCGDEPDRHAGQQRERDRAGDDRLIDADGRRIRQARKAARFEPSKKPRAGDETGKASDAASSTPSTIELPRHAKPAGAERHTRRQLARARSRVRATGSRC